VLPSPALLFSSLEIAQENDLLFYGVNETYSGILAGEALANISTTEKFCCTNHAPGVDVLAERCGGMKMGVQAEGKSITFDVTVDPNNCTAWEEAVINGGCIPDEGKDWASIGLYFAGQANHECGVEFLNKYPASYADASDLSTSLYAGMEAGLNILFGMSQQSYLQGYLPFSTLTLAATNGQMIENEVIKTGPNLVTVPPSPHQLECSNNNFAVCGSTMPVDPPAPSPEASVPSPQQPVETPATPSVPSSRALSQLTDYSHHITLAVGGLVFAAGGLILAN
jgi:hypothetical protein